MPLVFNHYQTYKILQYYYTSMNIPIDLYIEKKMNALTFSLMNKKTR